MTMERDDELLPTQAAVVDDANGIGATIGRASSRQLRISRDEKLLLAGDAIRAQPPADTDFAYVHSIMCQVGLPRSKVDGREFLRRSGDAWVNIQAGVLDEGNGPVLQPIPYGATPRLALAWVSTYAIRNRSREVPIGESASAFLRELGQRPTGGKRGAFTTLRKQMHALAACRLQIGFKGRTYNGQPVEQFDAWIADRDTNQKALWPGVMVLSENYYNELIEHGVPLDNRALQALKGSALTLDVYAWLAHRLHRIESRSIVLQWTHLHEQFGQEYRGKDPVKDFKNKFLPALEAVLVAYPQANVTKVRGGLMLKASPPPISPSAC